MIMSVDIELLRVKPRYFETVAMLLCIHTNRYIYYNSCPQCMKKVHPINSLEQSFSCSHCNIETNTPKPKFILTGKLIDSSTNLTVDIQDIPTKTLLGISAEEYKSKFGENSE